MFRDLETPTAMFLFRAIALSLEGLQASRSALSCPVVHIILPFVSKQHPEEVREQRAQYTLTALLYRNPTRVSGHGMR